MSASVLLLCSALCTVAGGALGAAWRRAETRRWRVRADYWAGVAAMPEGPTVARTLDQLMEER